MLKVIFFAPKILFSIVLLIPVISAEGQKLATPGVDSGLVKGYLRPIHNFSNYFDFPKASPVKVSKNNVRMLNMYKNIFIGGSWQLVKLVSYKLPTGFFVEFAHVKLKNDSVLYINTTYGKKFYYLKKRCSIDFIGYENFTKHTVPYFLLRSAKYRLFFFIDFFYKDSHIVQAEEIGFVDGSKMVGRF